MAIIVNLDVMLAKRKMTSLELAQRIGMTPANLSILKTGKAKAVRFSTMEAICRELECQPGDFLEYVADDPAPREAAGPQLIEVETRYFGKPQPPQYVTLEPKPKRAKPEKIFHVEPKEHTAVPGRTFYLGGKSTSEAESNDDPAKKV